MIGIINKKGDVSQTEIIATIKTNAFTGNVSQPDIQTELEFPHTSFDIKFIFSHSFVHGMGEKAKLGTQFKIKFLCRKILDHQGNLYITQGQVSYFFIGNILLAFHGIEQFRLKTPLARNSIVYKNSGMHAK